MEGPSQTEFNSNSLQLRYKLLTVSVLFFVRCPNNAHRAGSGSQKLLYCETVEYFTTNFTLQTKLNSIMTSPLLLFQPIACISPYENK